jgi:hypothetical protein
MQLYQSVEAPEAGSWQLLALPPSPPAPARFHILALERCGATQPYPPTAQPNLLAGTILTSAYQLFKEPVPDPQWAAVVPHFRHLTERERAAYDPEGAATHGWFYTTFIT